MMELQLIRTYFPDGTNGRLVYRNNQVCETIELPWRNNKRQVSCIPEGRYRLVRKMHYKNGEQLAVQNVPGREAILLHPGNIAFRDLQGCIAPVTKCTAPGKGSYSRIALDRLKELVYPVLAGGEEVYLIIRS
ncbi:hypothetical protein SAMN05216436_102146 [bacterium A37T11]|nr:hypothetical protein SAMN05216436_102146 [bacterium A37T11]